MASFEVRTNEHLIRSALWSEQLKDILMDELFAMKYVRILNVPSDAGSSTFNIPSLGEADTHDFVEGQRIKYDRFDTGNYQFTFDQYKYSANSISKKFERDSFYAQEVINAFLPRQHRALMEAVEVRILSVGNTGQTGSAAYSSNALMPINGGNHRWVAKGTNETMSIRDLRLAQYSLSRAKVPLRDLVAIVDPSVIYELQGQANVVNLMTPAPRWQNMVSNVTPTGMKFEMNLYGFDIYSSNYLPRSISETIDGTSVTTGVANYMFSATPGETMPIIGGFREMPKVYSQFDMDTQETRYLTICEYGFAGDYRPENMIVVLSDTDQVA